MASGTLSAEISTTSTQVSIQTRRVGDPLRGSCCKPSSVDPCSESLGGALQYACSYWASHLSKSTTEKDLVSDLETFVSNPVARLTGYTDAVIAAVFSKDNNRMASASNNAIILPWDTQSYMVCLICWSLRPFALPSPSTTPNWSAPLSTRLFVYGISQRESA